MIFWAIVGVLFAAYLLLIWRLVGDDDNDQDDLTPGRHERGVFDADPEATVVLASVPSWYQLASEGNRTDRILERAAALLDG